MTKVFDTLSARSAFNLFSLSTSVLMTSLLAPSAFSARILSPWSKSHENEWSTTQLPRSSARACSIYIIFFKKYIYIIKLKIKIVLLEAIDPAAPHTCSFTACSKIASSGFVCAAAAAMAFLNFGDLAYRAEDDSKHRFMHKRNVAVKWLQGKCTIDHSNGQIGVHIRR